jgi:hypothetical protein
LILADGVRIPALIGEAIGKSRDAIGTPEIPPGAVPSQPGLNQNESLHERINLKTRNVPFYPPF